MRQMTFLYLSVYSGSAGHFLSKKGLYFWASAIPVTVSAILRVKPWSHILWAIKG